MNEENGERTKEKRELQPWSDPRLPWPELRGVWEALVTLTHYRLTVYGGMKEVGGGGGAMGRDDR